MFRPSPRNATVSLIAQTRGDADAAAGFIAQVYDTLRPITDNLIRPERPDHKLQPTALPNELSDEALKKLATRNRRQIQGAVLHLLSGFHIKEIADPTGISERNVVNDQQPVGVRLAHELRRGPEGQR